MTQTSHTGNKTEKLFIPWTLGIGSRDVGERSSGSDRVEGAVVFRDGGRLGRGLVRRELAICSALATRAERVNLTGMSVRYLMVISRVKLIERIQITFENKAIRTYINYM